MWLCAGEDVTSSSEFKKPDPQGHSVQRGTNPPATRDDRWGGDGTDPTMAGLESGAAGATGGNMAGRGFGVKQGQNRSWRI